MKLLKPLIVILIVALAASTAALAAPAKSQAKAEQSKQPARTEQGKDQGKYVRKVVEAEATGDFKQVQDACQEALKSGQLDWAHELYVYQNRAMSYYIQRKFDLAAADFSRIIAQREKVVAYYTHNPDEQIYKILRLLLPAAYMWRSIINEQEKRPKQALEDLENYFKVSPAAPDKADLERRRKLKQQLGQLK